MIEESIIGRSMQFTVKSALPNEPPKVTRHRMICDRLNHIYDMKNHDYGDSFAQLRKRRPDAVLVRLFDKYPRLETLMSGRTARVDESIDDTLMGMANYCIMELVERQEDTCQDQRKQNSNPTIPARS